jgi:hypothetical protein
MKIVSQPTVHNEPNTNAGIIFEHRIAVVEARLPLILATRGALPSFCGLLSRSRARGWTGVAATCESIGTKICSAIIFMAGLAKYKSDRKGDSIGGRFKDPKIVIASRNSNVALTSRGTLIGCSGGRLISEAATVAAIDVVSTLFSAVGRP